LRKFEIKHLKKQYSDIKKMETLQIGQKASVKRIFSQEDLNRFAMLSGDDNPIHVDPVFSSRTKFGKPVVHGMLLYSAICAAIGKWFSGNGFVQLSQELMFPAPTFVDQKVEIQLEVFAFPTPGTMEISSQILRPDGEAGCIGKTRILQPNTEYHYQRRNISPSVAEKEDASHRGLSIGQSASRTSIFTGGSWGQLGMFLALVGDGNLFFWDSAYAQKHGFEGVILPGGLLGGMISDLLGTEVPGWGTNWLKQRFDFLKPAYPNATITANVEIIRLRPEKDLVNLRTTCTDPVGDLVLDGEALVWVSDLEIRG
jgi:acyl dehydratase